MYNRDSSEPDKQRACAAWLAALWDRRAGRLSTQVLSEYYAVLTRKLEGVSKGTVRSDIRRLATWRPVALTTDLIESAWALQDHYSLPWWDALIAAAAREAGCDRLLTEDFAEGLDIDGVLVTSPFSTTPGAVLPGG